jgi:serine/threonine protein kinase/cell division protein FtsN
MIKTITDDAAKTKQAAPNQWFGELAANGWPGPANAPVSNSAGVPTSIPARYKILSQLGTGGTGIVYKVRDLETGEIVALKVLRPGIASDQEMQQNLRKEMCLARKVTHKNVCRIHEFNRLNGAACLSMEFVEGENMLSRLRRVGPLNIDETLEIARQICAGLHEAHLQGIVHRDLKPANIMLDRNGVVKIMDFGIARLSEGNVQMTGTIAGTPAYMAPEQVELKPMGPRTDIYSLGLLLYEMVTGIPTFEGDTPIALALKQVREIPKRPREIVPSVPAHVEALILKCLQKDPAKRFQSVAELLAALEKDATTRLSLEFRLPDLKMHRWAPYGMEKARAARPHLSAFAVKVQKAAIDAKRVVSEETQKAIAFVRAYDYRAMKFSRTQSIAATLGVVLLGTVIAFGISGKGHARAAAAGPSFPLTLQSSPSPAAQSAPLPFDTVSPDDADSTVATSEVDLGRIAGSATENASGAASGHELPASPATSAAIAKKATPSPARANSAHAKNRSSLSAAPKPTAAAMPQTADATNAQTSANANSDLSAAVLPLSPLDPALKTTALSGQPNPAGTKSDLHEYYLEVGSFKDANRADQAADQLTRLGFHAVSIHKAKLWMHSYHVQVGPYVSQIDVEAAQRSLASQDFKSNLVK